MADVHTKEQRRFNMQQIKGKNTRPEMLLRKYLFAQGYRYKTQIQECKYKKLCTLRAFYNWASLASHSCTFYFY